MCRFRYLLGPLVTLPFLLKSQNIEIKKIETNPSTSYIIRNTMVYASLMPSLYSLIRKSTNKYDTTSLIAFLLFHIYFIYQKGTKNITSLEEGRMKWCNVGIISFIAYLLLSFPKTRDNLILISTLCSILLIRYTFSKIYPNNWVAIYQGKKI